VPDLVFDRPDDASPRIEDKFLLGGPVPILKFIEHQGDTLFFQGSSFNGIGNLGEFATPQLFRMPLDIPDLPQSARSFYGPAELADLALDLNQAIPKRVLRQRGR
jgi:hypothetical protein